MILRVKPCVFTIVLIALVNIFPMMVRGQSFNKKSRTWNTVQASKFIENAGQLTDQNGNKRSDVKYIYIAPGFKAIFKENSFCYELYTIAESQKSTLVGTEPTAAIASLRPDYKIPETIVTKTHRIDITLAGANKTPEIIVEEESSDYNNYYLAHTSEKGIQGIHSFSKLTYRNIWNGIDIIFYTKKEGELKYDIILHPGSKMSDIKFIYDGAENINTENNNIFINTSLGPLQESIPLSYMKDDYNKVDVRYKADRNTISYSGNYDKSKTLVIDPILNWGTYYGGRSHDYGIDIITDATGAVYVTGYTNSTTLIATSGAYQTVYGGASVTWDAFVLKLTSSGQRVWCTYYGGSKLELVYGLACDRKANLYIVGQTESTNAIATSSAHQTSFGGGDADGFLAKFDSTGKRIWSTYYGGAKTDYGVGVSCDDNNIFIAGSTQSNSSIATGSSYQATFAGGHNDGFIAKFNSSGKRIWSTYYGGINSEYLDNIVCDGYGNVYANGSTNSKAGIATIGSHQDGFGGYQDAFLVKLDTSGSVKWGTYYGGDNAEYGYCITCDEYGNVYISGQTLSKDSIATNSAHQTSNGGIYDGYIVKFNSAGKRQWGTFYGGDSWEWINDIFSDQSGYLYITGYTSSKNAIASPKTYDSILDGSTDVFLAKFNYSGVKQWATYYGGKSVDQGYGVCSDKAGNIYITGYTGSDSAITTPNAYQVKYGDSIAWNAFVAKFNSKDIAYDSLLNLPGKVCYEDSFLLSAVLKNLYIEADSNYHITTMITGPDSFLIVDSFMQVISQNSQDTFKFSKWMKIAVPGEYSVKSFIRSKDENQWNDTVYASIKVYKNPVPTLKVLSACLDSNMTFDIDSIKCNGVMSYSWIFDDPGSDSNNYSSLANPSHTFNDTGIYKIRLVVETANLSDTFYRIVKIKDKPNVDLGDDITICDGDSVRLNAGNAKQILWSTGDTIPQITIKDTGKYWVRVQSDKCTSADTIHIFYSHDSLNLGKDTILCQGDVFTLDISKTNAKYLWSTGDSSAILNISQSGKYWGQRINGRCTVSDTIVVSFLSLDQFSLGPDTAICSGRTLILKKNIPNAKYKWSNNSTADSLTINETGTYWLHAQVGGCDFIDTINVAIVEKSDLNLGPDRLLCQTTSLDAGIKNASYIWSTGDTTKSIKVMQDGNYWVSVRVGNCLFQDTVKLSFVDSPNAFLGKDTTICQGSTIVLKPDVTSSGFKWSTGSSDTAIEVNAAGIYWARIKVGDCEFVDSINVQVNSLPPLNLGPDTTVCNSIGLILDTKLDGTKHLWSTGATTRTIPVTESGKYWVTVSAGSCQASDTIKVRIENLADYKLGKDTVICQGEKVILSALNANGQFLWNTGSKAYAIEVREPGIYWLASKVGTCTTIDSIKIDVVAVPEVSLGNDTTLCEGEEFMLDARNKGANYIWSTGEISQKVKAKTTGKYWVEVKQGNCSNSDTIYLNICPPKIFIPNAFTPNSDNVNDNFRVYGSDIAFCELQIFNRWGECIFYSTEMDKSWDGKFKNVACQMDMYFWIFKYKGAITPSADYKVLNGVIYLVK